MQANGLTHAEAATIHTYPDPDADQGPSDDPGTPLPRAGGIGSIPLLLSDGDDPRPRRVRSRLEALRRAVTHRFDSRTRAELDRLRHEVVMLHASGNAFDAEASARRLVKLQGVALGDRHPDYATSLGNLALLLQKRGERDAAEPLLRQSLEIRREVLGERHPKYATAMSNLALLLLDRGDFDAAEPLLRQSLEIRREALGEHHADYATSLGGLALLFQKRGDLDAAEQMLRQAREIRREVLGERHPQYATTLSRLAMLLLDRGDFDAAEPLLLHALEIRRAALGEDHPDTATIRNGLALLFQKRGTPDGEPPSPTQDQAQDHVDDHAPVDPLALRDELASWIATFAAVGAALRRSALLMETGGFPPSSRIMREAAECEHAFARLRPEVIRHAEAAGLPPESSDVLSLPGLAGLLDAAIAALDKDGHAACVSNPGPA